MRAAMAFALLAIAATWPLVLSLDRLMLDAGGPHDAFIFLWDFWWANQALVERGVDPLFCDLIYAPHGSTLAVHSHALAQSIFSIPFQILIPGVKGLVVATNAVVLISFWLAGLGAFRLAKQLFGSSAGAALAGVSFALCNYHFANTVRLHALPIEIFPWALHFLLLFLERRCRRHLIGLSLVAGWGFYAAPEYAVHLALLVTLLLPLLLLVSPKLSRHLSARDIFTLGLGVALLALLLTPFFFAVGEHPPPPPDPALRGYNHYFSMDLADYALGNPKHPLHGNLFRSAQRHLHNNEGFGVGQSYGVVLLALLATLSAIRKRRRALLPWIAVTLSFALLSLGPSLRILGWTPGIPLPEHWISQLPGLAHARMPMRYVVVAQLGLGLLAASWLGRSSWSEKRKALVVAFVAFELWNAPLSLSKIEVPSLYEVDARVGEHALLDLPHGTGSSMLVESLHQIVHGQRLVQDVIAFIPRADEEVRRTALGPHVRGLEDALLEGEPLDASTARSWLEDLGIAFVIVRRDDLDPKRYERARRTAVSWKPEEFLETPHGFRARYLPR